MSSDTFIHHTNGLWQFSLSIRCETFKDPIDCRYWKHSVWCFSLYTCGCQLNVHTEQEKNIQGGNQAHIKNAPIEEIKLKEVLHVRASPADLVLRAVQSVPGGNCEQRTKEVIIMLSLQPKERERGKKKSFVTQTSLLRTRTPGIKCSHMESVGLLIT